ncbi:MAG TPA: DUF2218 domain-containing protein [Acetobacteraceae bacterium]|jgi:hypothetical protein|nr:DUF2218 domain-containing protein [Acetobacteraceae bacterium]
MSECETATATVRSTAEVATPQAGRYLTQLCKHFQHKCPVTQDEASGHIAFSTGDCRLRAEAGILTLSLQAAGDAQLAQLQDVVSRHLIRFAFREAMQIVWRPVLTFQIPAARGDFPIDGR